jgi:3-hydroxybutyryl-CoA dehydrogenase
MKSILVIGAGFMGSGIAQVCAQAGWQVNLMDTSALALDRAMADAKWSLDKLSSKGHLKDAPGTIVSRILPQHDLRSAARASWIIEAVPEIESLKKQIFREVDRIAPSNTPLASNTSTVPITRLARATQRPERILGLHFFGPVPLMGLVEVIKGEKTSKMVFERGLAFVKSLGKTPVRVEKDVPGFIMNRIFSAALRQAIDLVAEGVTTVEDVDAGMRLGYGWTAGPFEIADNAGIDTYALIGQSLTALGAEDLVPRSNLIERLVSEGRLGRKVGKGFYRYTLEGRRLPWNRQD